MEKVNIAKKHGLNLSWMVVLLTAGFTTIVSVIVGVVLTTQTVNRMMTMVSNKAMELAATAAGLLDGDSLKGITKDDQQSPAYLEAYETLATFKLNKEGSNGELAYVYCCRSKGNNHFEFTIDPSDDPALFGEEVEWTYALDAASKGQVAFDKEPSTDRWGTFYSAFAPVFDSNKEVAMIVGVDMWADWYVDTIRSYSISTAALLSITIASGILVGVGINIGIRRRFDTLSKDFDDLKGDVRLLLNEIQIPMGLPPTSETEGRRDSLTQMREKIHTTQKEIKHYISYTKKLAYLDGLTLVNNRAAYVERIDRIDLATPFAVMVFDINGLKYVNDHHGHETGDEIIIALSKILTTLFREQDVFRIGGDEFVVILAEADKEATLALYESFPTELGEYNARSELPVSLSVSRGIAFLNKKKDKAYRDVFNRADADMYKDKEAFYEKNPHVRHRY